MKQHKCKKDKRDDLNNAWGDRCKICGRFIKQPSNPQTPEEWGNWFMKWLDKNAIWQKSDEFFKNGKKLDVVRK